MHLIGKELRGIRLLKKLGTGGMGTVYLGRVLKARRGLEAGRDVAVKVLHIQLSGEKGAVSRFKLEAGLGLSLRHPNIVRIFQVGSERIDGVQVHFLVQEFLQGVTLNSLSEEFNPLSDLFLRKIALQIAEALEEIHGKDIIHRDLKPENVFLEPDGTVKLVDFGFSLLDRGLRNRESGSRFLGTVAYSAPERFGISQADKASDLYSVGVMLYELSVGKNPFLGDDLTSTVSLHMDQVPAAPIRLNPHISPFMSFLIMSLLEKNPRKRLGPSSRLVRVIKKGEASRWWRTVRPEQGSDRLSPRRRRLNVSRRVPVFGRRKERALLLKAIDQVILKKKGRVVCLVGEAGSGKTRLIDQLLATMDRAGRPGKFMMVDGTQGSVQVPYLPLISGLQRTFHLEHLHRDALRKELVEQFKSFFPNDTPRVERFVHFLISALPGSKEEEAAVFPELAIQFFGEFFMAMARREPLILAVENVTDADPPTVRVVSELMERLVDAPVLLIQTARPGASCAGGSGEESALADLLDRVNHREDGTVIHLQRLQRASVARMLGELGFPDKVAGGPFGERVFSITEGNPYLVLEIARWVETENRVDKDRVNWLGLLEEIPSSIQDIFYRRIFRVSPPERRFLDFAAVVGRRFKVDEVVEGLGLNFQDAARVVSRLVHQHALIRAVNNSYRFDHTLIRDLLYNSLDPVDRAYYHCQVGAYYNILASKRELSGRECYKAGVHYSRGNNPGQALRFFLRAFDYLRFKHYHARALQLAEQAAAHIEAVRGSGDEPDSSFICEVFLKQAEIAGYLGRRNVQFTALKKALSTVRICSDPLIKALVRLRIGQYYSARSRHISAIHYLESALSRMRGIGESKGAAEALQSLGQVLAEMGAGDQALKYFREAREIRTTQGDQAGEASVLVDMGTHYLASAKPVAAREALVKARRLYRMREDERGQASVQLGLAKIDLDLGDLPKAETSLRKALRGASLMGDVALEIEIYETLGQCKLKIQAFDEADQAFEEALRLADRVGDTRGQVKILLAQAQLILDPESGSSNLPRAQAKAREAVNLSREAALIVRERSTALGVLASVYLRMNQRLSAFALFRKAVRLLKAEGGEETLQKRYTLHMNRVAKELEKVSRLPKRFNRKEEIQP